MGWKGNCYFRGSKQIKTWRALRDGDGNPVLEEPSILVDWFDDFLGRHPFIALSNFYEGEPIEIDGEKYMTGEHAFHAGKADTAQARRKIQTARTPEDAKQMGRSVRIRPGWDRRRVAHMRKVLRAKFASGRKEAKILLRTGHAKLVEGTLWHDNFWGVDLEAPGRPGRNTLGRLLMAQRNLLRGGRR